MHYQQTYLLFPVSMTTKSLLYISRVCLVRSKKVVYSLAMCTFCWIPYFVFTSIAVCLILCALFAERSAMWFYFPFRFYIIWTIDRTWQSKLIFNGRSFGLLKAILLLLSCHHIIVYISYQIFIHNSRYKSRVVDAESKSTVETIILCYNRYLTYISLR